MRRVSLGGTGFTTSRLGFGTASLHHIVSSSARQRLLGHARARGIQYFDTAPLYGHESAERELGRFAKNGRTDLVIATKTGIVPDTVLSMFPTLLYGRLAWRQLLRRTGVGPPPAAVPRRDYAAEYTRRRVERSLKLLGTDYIDILYLHEPSLRLIPDPDGLALELERLRTAGKVRHVGISGFVLDAVEISARAPGLAEILQLDASTTDASWSSLRRAGRAPHATFGHFRGHDPRRATAQSRHHWLNDRLRAASRLNPDGVIVFSSRKPGHIDETVDAMAALERKG